MDLEAMIKEAQKLQADMEGTQKQLAMEEVTVTNDTGDVSVRITGAYKFTLLTISESLKNGSPENLQKEVLLTFQNALAASVRKNQEAMQKVTAQLSLSLPNTSSQIKMPK